MENKKDDIFENNRSEIFVAAYLQWHWITFEYLGGGLPVGGMAESALFLGGIRNGLKI